MMSDLREKDRDSSFNNKILRLNFPPPPSFFYYNYNNLFFYYRMILEYICNRDTSDFLFKNILK